jgi:hypothetical protein
MVRVRYRLSVRVNSPAASGRQVWLEGRGEGGSLGRVTRAAQGAVAQAVRELYRRISAMGDARVPEGRGG